MTTTHTPTAADAYVRRIRNTRKKGYARAYLRFLRRQGPLSCPPIAAELSTMAAQAVRMNLFELVQAERG